MESKYSLKPNFNTNLKTKLVQKKQVGTRTSFDFYVLCTPKSPLSTKLKIYKGKTTEVLKLGIVSIPARFSRGIPSVIYGGIPRRPQRLLLE